MSFMPDAPETAKGKRLEAEAIINDVARLSLRAAMLLWEAELQERELAKEIHGERA